MNFDFLGDWPAYLSMIVFVVFITYIIVKSLGAGAESTGIKTETTKK